MAKKKAAKKNEPDVINDDPVLGELNENQKEFCRQYLLNGYNGTKAYMIVYPNSSYDAASVSAYDNLRKPKIQDYIKELQEDTMKTVGLTPEMIADEYIKLAFSSIAHLHNTWIERKDFEKLSDREKACIQDLQYQTRSVAVPDGEEGFKEVQIDFVKVKLYSKTEALKELKLMFGLNAAEKRDVNLSGIPIVNVSSDATKDAMNDIAGEQA